MSTSVNLDLGVNGAPGDGAAPTPSSSTAPPTPMCSQVFGDSTGVAVLGLQAQMNITGARATPTTSLILEAQGQ